MAVFTIGDTHLSLGSSKPMDIFSGWDNYVCRLEENWRRLISDEDTVVIAGDVSWGISLEEAKQDFVFLNSLPGKKILMKGNHDYWWTTVKKMTEFLEASGLNTLSFLFNNCHVVDGTALCGTRSWLFDVGEPHDEKVMNRELGRLKMSLDAAGDLPKIAFLHYPPLCAGAHAEGVLELLHQYGVRRCYYGHLHGAAIRRAFQGERDGIEFRLVSADSVDFCPVKISI